MIETRPAHRDRETFLATELIDNLIEDILPPIADCPSMINLEQHRLGQVLLDFRRSSDRMAVNLMRTLKTSPEITGLDRQSARDVINRKWFTEFYQNIFYDKGRWFFTDVRQGEIGGYSIVRKKLGDPRNDTKKITIHYHPAEQTFSPSDLQLIFLALDADRILGYSDNKLLPKVTLMFVVTDRHSFMTFPSAETIVPDFPEALADGLGTHEFMGELMPGLFGQAWEKLIEEYGEEKLFMFTGQRLVWENHLFPDGVNDEGDGLINLAYSLGVCQKYHLPLYVSDRSSSIYHRVKSLSDIYPALG